MILFEKMSFYTNLRYIKIWSSWQWNLHYSWDLVLISSLAAGSIAPPSWPPRRGSSWWGWRSHACGGSPWYLARRGTGPHTGRAVLHLSWFGLHYLRHALYCNYAITFPFVIFKFFLDNPNVYSNHNFHSIVKQIFCISRVVKKNSKSKYDSKWKSVFIY